MTNMKYIFVHGLGQTNESWTKTLSFMEDPSGFLSPNLSELLSGKEITYTNLYDAFSEYCDHLSDPLTLCGLSLGGILALQYAIENPARVKSLILIGTQYCMPRKTLKLQNIVFQLLPGRVFQKIGFDKKDMIRLTNSMMDLNFLNDLHKIICPVLILCGEKDQTNKKASVELSNLIPHARIDFIKNSGHEVNMDAPEELSQVINAFLLTATSHQKISTQ